MYRFNFDAPIYLGTADNAAQDLVSNPEMHLNFQLTVLTILGFNPVVGAPFLWQSNATLSAVENRMELFEHCTGPSLGGRPDTKTASDYFSQREQDTRHTSRLYLRPDSAFHAERPGSLTLNWQRNIAPDIQVSPRKDSVEKHFRSLFVSDTEESASPLSIRAATLKGFGAKFSRAGRNRTDYLLSSIGARAFGDHFSRALIEDSFLREDSCFTSLNSVLYRTSALYQAANGLAHNGVLFTTVRLYRYLPNDIKLTVLHRYSISPMNPYLFGDVLAGIGVHMHSWVNVDSLKIMKILNSHNPLGMFSTLYTNYLIAKILEWREKNLNPSYQSVVSILRKELFYENDWQKLEFISGLSGRKYDGLAAGLVGGGAGFFAGVNPLMAGGAARQIVEYGYKVIDGLSFFEILRMRAVLKRYLREVGLLTS